ncbi:NUDIX hydrolase [Streptomyces sp. NPDC004752]
MTDLTVLNEVDALVIRSHSDGITDITAAALIQQHGRFLLIHAGRPDLSATQAWRLPSGPVLPGETVPDGLHRILAQHFGYSDVKITGFLGTIDTDDSGTRTFVFAINASQPDSICRDGDLPHRWIDNITVSDLIPGINPVLHTYYAADSS